MHTVLEIKGRKYTIEGQEPIINKVLSIDYQKDKGSGDEIVFDKVLVYRGEFGQPCLNVRVVSEVVKELSKAKKIIVFKRKAKKRYKVKRGHRQPYTWVKITKVEPT
ncbi:50S ribosomal protein L21 [endosymbiont GvMRE of Glomus versiforme]|uniref:50S ribosomal protein L21 n=1 Tax=endosymbiont GvMRE of Glomus versiforme TaxID=2039283 RepID=UPI000ECB80C2|nr:50S ribosomal protein L21 [endosymbiont GvMRE of Glomus versiforme]RHZ36362.1 50S ribosomal protein L21 [endosymbiont GvMRE of Glomus versiforme]